MNAAHGVVVVQKLGANVNPFEVVQTMVEYADRWVAEVQRANTDRAAIAAWEHVQTDKIHAQRAVLLKALTSPSTSGERTSADCLMPWIRR